MGVTFTKLFSSITESTVWCEPAGTRLTWITMLAMADRNGRVFGSVPGLANRARVTVDEARAAIASFLSPDPDSRTKDHEGRRIEEIDGGWRLLNHAKYRALRDDEARKEYKREWIANDRMQKKLSTSEVLWARDSGRCGICGGPIADRNDDFEIDHIKPVVLGGGHSMRNKQLAHKVCNRSKIDGRSGIAFRHASMPDVDKVDRSSPQYTQAEAYTDKSFKPRQRARSTRADAKGPKTFKEILPEQEQQALAARLRGVS